MITVLAGGTGSAKLARGLVKATSERLTFIVNVGDNITMHGLYICPDIDTILYALAGILDTKRGWGVKGDTFHFLHQLSRYGFETWFKLGDRDLAMHIARSVLIRSGLTLSEATGRLREMLGVEHRVIPASNQNIETKIITPEGEMHLQEFWVKHSGAPEVRGVRYDGPEHPHPAPGVVEAICEAERVVICPANPVTSIGPIVAVPGIRNALKSTSASVIALSPIVCGRAVSGPAGKFMHALGLAVSPLGVVKLYRDFLDGIVIDRRDEGLLGEVEGLDVKAYVTDILMKNRRDEARLAKFILNLP